MAEKDGLFLRRFDEEHFGIRPGDGQGDAGNATAASDVGKTMLALWQERKNRQRVGDMQSLGLGAIGDPREVHRLIGEKQQIQVTRKLGVLFGRERDRGGICEALPEVIHGVVTTVLYPGSQ